MQPNPKISIIVPIYKVELYLSDCINSLINQTYASLEIILVDDGSPDNCGKICDEYAQKDSRIKVIHKENGGLVSARNAGYKAATGDWIMYLDGDDWIDINTCERLMHYTKKYDNNIDVVFWNAVTELNTCSIKGKWEWTCEDNEHLYTDTACLNLAYNTLIYKLGIATAYCKLIRKDFASSNALFHNIMLRQGLEGVEFSLRVFAAAKKVLFVKEYFHHYRYVADSISKKVDEKNTQFIIDCFREIEKYIITLPQAEYFQQAFDQRILYALIAIAMNTYFHRDNKDSFKNKVAKFKIIADENIFFRNALKYGDFSQFDILRRVALYIIKVRFYFLLPIISNLKYYFLKKGKYSY
jgi:glycosyltransferase involved in cell wall biosynthesis